MALVLPYGIQSYRRADLPEIRLNNVYAEKVPEQVGNVVLLGRPGITPAYTVGSGPINGLFQQAGAFSGDTFAVSNKTLFRNSASIGDTDALDNVQMIAADTSLLIATDTALWRFDGTALSQVGFPDGAGVVSVAYLGGYAVAARAGSRRFYFTLDPGTWDGLDYLSAEQSTDPIVGIMVVVDQLWIFCARHTEIFFLTGDPDAPFQRVQGRLFDKGARDRDTIQPFDNTVVWVGQDNVVYRGGDIPNRISDHGIEERLAESLTVSALVYPWRGHLFYALKLDSGTFSYDAATQQWCEISSYGRNSWRLKNATRLGDMFGDDQTGQLWKLQDGLYTDNGQPIVREWTAIINKRGFADRVDVNCATGYLPTDQTPPGIIELRTSRDGGSIWTDWDQAEMGYKGQYNTRPSFRGLGLVDANDMILHFRLTDPYATRISNLTLNDIGGGRGA